MRPFISMIIDITATELVTSRQAPRRELAGLTADGDAPALSSNGFGSRGRAPPAPPCPTTSVRPTSWQES